MMPRTDNMSGMTWQRHAALTYCATGKRALLPAVWNVPNAPVRYTVITLVRLAEILYFCPCKVCVALP